MNKKVLLATMVGLTSGIAISAAVPENNSVNDRSVDLATVPYHPIVMNGSEKSTLHEDVLNALLDSSELHFQDPGVPRYLLVDKEGVTALGIGGYVEGVAQADFRGAIDANGFKTYSIPVPSSPTMRSRLGADVTHSTIFLKLIRKTRFGILNAYIQTNFTGDNGGYGMKLKQAYVSLGNVTAGLTNSSFVDPSAGVPTIDYQGPSGEISGKNILIRYSNTPSAHFKWAVSVEMPKATITANEFVQSINQHVPDIPSYIQYQWGTGSHLRASAILRNLSYRDLVTAENRIRTGYGVQLSGIYDYANLIDVYYAGAYGCGIGNYVNDLSGAGMDLIASPDKEGIMIAPRTFGLVGGVKVNIGDNFFVSGSYSFNRLYDQEQLGGDTYKRANYVVANAFYTPLSSLQVGIEYLHGTRKNVNNESSAANRIELMVKYSF